MDADYKPVSTSKPFWEMDRNWFIARFAAVCFVTAVALSHLIKPGIRVQKVTLAEDTPAPKFIPTDAEPHPVALFAHEYAGLKKTLFRYLRELPPLPGV